MADYRIVLADLRTQCAALDKEKAELNTAITAIERLMKRSSSHVVKSSSNGRFQPASHTPVARPSGRVFAGMTMPKAITKALEMSQQPQTTRHIRETLRAGGARIGKSFANS